MSMNQVNFKKEIEGCCDERILETANIYKKVKSKIPDDNQ